LQKRGVRLLAVALAAAVVMHGLYDLIVMNGVWCIILLLFLRLMFESTRSLLEYLTAISPYRVSLTAWVQSYPNPAVEAGLECMHCGSTNPKLTYRLEHIRVQKCDRCQYFVATHNSLY
jgi:hypothetical protein